MRGQTNLNFSLRHSFVHLFDIPMFFNLKCIAMNFEGMIGSEPAPRQPAGAMPDHCPMCLLRADLAAPPAMPVAVALRADLGHVQPTLFLQAAHTLYAWSSAPARAPPSLV